MPEPTKMLENMKGHLTKAQRSARRQAESGFQRNKRIMLRTPAWLSPEARTIFNTAKHQLRGLGVLDNSDAELLGMYADALARYRQAVLALTSEDTKGATAAQAWSRLALSYAEKLGISAAARARLAKRRADQEPPDDMAQILEDVTEFVNGER